MLTSQALHNMRQASIEQVDPAALVSVDAVLVERSLPHEQKVLSVIAQMKNPYCFLSGGVPVKVCFAQCGKNLSDSLINYVSMLKRNSGSCGSYCSREL